MADPNFEAERLAELMAKANDELARYGQLTQSTSDRINDARMKELTGLNNFTKSASTAASAIGAVASAGSEAAKAMLEGKKGAAAFNSSLDEMSKAATLAGAALTLLVPGGIIIKGVIAGLTAVATASMAYAKAANEMADKQYKAYSGLQKSGAAAADGMAGVFRDAKKLGLSMNELDSMVGLIASSSEDLAQFAGTVYDGRKKFADMGQALEGNRAGFLKMGLSMQDVNEGMIGYMKTVTRTGRAQTMTQEQMAASARNYIYEQDALAKITGLSAKKQQEATERALQNEQFLAKIRDLEARGETGKADQLKKLNIYYTQMGEEAAAGFQASVNGNLRNKDAQRLNMTAQGEVLRGINGILNGTETAATAFDRTAESVKRYEAGPGRALAALDAGAEVGLKLSTQVNFANAATKDRAELEKQVNAELEKQGAKSGKAADAATDAMGNLIKTQIDANKKIETFVDAGIVPATNAMAVLAKATADAATGLSHLADGSWWSKVKNFFGQGERTQSERTGRTTENAPTTTQSGMDFLQFADGGIAKGPQTGYLVELHGEEAVIPKDKLADAEKVGNYDQALGKNSPMGKAQTEILKDTKTIEKLTDSDTKRVLEYNLFYKNYTEDMQAALAGQLEAVQNSGSPDGSTGAASATSGSGINPMGGSSIGLKMPTAVPMASMGGGTGLKINSQNDLKKMGLNIKAGDVQAEGAGINPKLLELAKSIQQNVPGFNYFSAFNDKFHQEKASSSEHTKGNAVDFTMFKDPTVEEGRAITNWLRQSGASLAIDEYNNPSSKATAGHIHAQIPGFAKGGVVQNPQLAMVGEERPEAIIPLENGAVPVRIDGKTGQPQNANQDLKMMMDALMAKLDNSQVLAALQEMIKTQKAGVDVQTKLLKAQA